MHADAPIDMRTTRLMDFIMDAALGGALAAFVLSGSVLLTLGVLCALWAGGMTVLDHI
ncbi:hypothetical protein [Salipiger abyssi]|uniref:Uncharacterized protein n=2 Tax=Salipiger abyssi TaxID=1250539 RepID=A0A1P8UZD9_9RHOB|nr:hypothetical protein Ga0080574_TMP4419 [Salipiger abyssi]